jgi:hypothetical protein
VAAGATYFVLLPILRPPLDTGLELIVDEGDDPDDDMSPQAVALRALKEVEFDRATGKLSDADYDQLKAKYTAEAVAAMREAGTAMRDAGSITPVHPPARIPHPACLEHGPRPEQDAQFCSDCGRRLGAAPGYCARCGTALEGDARYCNGCGARVAA